MKVTFQHRTFEATRAAWILVIHSRVRTAENTNKTHDMMVPLVLPRTDGDGA